MGEKGLRNAGLKPTELKRRLGTLDRGNTGEPLQILEGVDPNDIPEPLRPLGTPGRDLWDRVWRAGFIWISPESDIELLQMLAESLDERQALRNKVFRAGDDADWRDRVALRAADKQIMLMMRELGFTPSERSRIGLAEVRTRQALVSMAAAGKPVFK